MTKSLLGVDQTILRTGNDCISVCICTLNRPELLSRLLAALPEQAGAVAFQLEVVVVDNDKDRSAEATVRRFQSHSGLPTIYACEPEQNISLARNCAIRNASGNLIAFIDDDEYPDKDWLLHLYQTLNRYEADGVLGPVVAEFPPGAPEWLKQGDFFNRRRQTTGATISLKDSRTGNVLLRRALFPEKELWFDPIYGRTGGEDGDFFVRKGSMGHRFVWCDEAVAHETVPPGRWKLSFHLKKSFRIGSLTGESIRGKGLHSIAMVGWNVSILGVLGLLLPVILLTKKHVSARMLMKMAYCAGYLSGFCGLDWLQTKE